ncbi:hypothetical protein PPL_08185 [Heterostelium album PN500]|uniref:COI1 F-box domain-containing protein n=1 Tax=Heterostelium pallidum (strain ATCC 26659 / Pp 5 / PN500) TaxID=670386 RepID=D3BIV0_HETP5|nr:hypothetical protein PPL_08185 [Heterostelium album PN500]EFA78724.1 hypothetical protein PPL_08185 [Heterostelium album PN500]|eukprot:XP_020430848.1 hypothetical protein PPL_08185 [Heterostelium album PN500]
MRDNHNKGSLVNFSHLLLSKIVGYLTDNIDKICFSLVCKRWFDDRDKYLAFNIDSLKLQHNNKYPEFFLNSYKDLLLRSLSTKNNCDLYISNDILNAINYDYILNKNNIKDIQTLPRNINTLLVRGTGDEHHADLSRLLLYSNVVHIYGCWGLPLGGFPIGIKTIVFNKFNQRLTPGFFPEGIRKINLGYNFNQPLEAGHLPSTLKYLGLGDLFDHAIAPGTLPSGLEHLYFGFVYNQPFEAGSLPDSLRILRLSSKFNQPLGRDVLPPLLNDLEICRNFKSSLHSLPASLEKLKFHNFSNLWIPKIQSLSNLKYLMLIGEDTFELNPGDLPENIESLSLHKCTIHGSAIPKSVKSLNISFTEYLYEEIFPVGVNFHFEELVIGNVKLDKHSLDNVKINQLCLDHYFHDLEEGSIPHGIETVSLGHNINLAIPPGVLPNSVKQLVLADTYEADSLKRGSIPPSVENLSLKSYFANMTTIEDGVISDSVKTLSLDCTLSGFKSIPNTIVNINLTSINYDYRVLCKIRKLDDNYYLIFGRPEQFGLVSGIFHKSHFLDRFFNSLPKYDLFSFTNNLFNSLS